MKKAVYLDHNIFISLKDKEYPELNARMDNSDQDKEFFLFSPAHIEEKVKRKASREEIEADLNFISKITKNETIRPFGCTINPFTNEILTTTVLFAEESPFECEKRVIAGLDRTKLAEDIDLEKLIEQNENSSHEAIKMNGCDIQKELSICLEYFINELVKLFPDFLLGIDKDDLMENYKNLIHIKDYHFLREAFIELVADKLEELHYWNDNIKKKKGKMSSRTHDVSHTIYASYCEVFVSNDERTVLKARAIYDFLGIETKVLFMKEFIAQEA